MNKYERFSWEMNTIVYFAYFQWTAAPLMDNLPIDTYHYLITVHTGVGKEAGTTSNVSLVMSGELADSGVRKLSDGKNQVSLCGGSVFAVDIQVCLECLDGCCLHFQFQLSFRAHPLPLFVEVFH